MSHSKKNSVEERNEDQTNTQCKDPVLERDDLSKHHRAAASL